MSEENKNKKSAKYNDVDTKKEGSPIETPFKHSDTRSAAKRAAAEKLEKSNKADIVKEDEK